MLIPSGEILDIAEIAATPAIIEGCVKGIEKEGSAEFKVFGKKHTLSMNKPTDKPSATRPPESSHSPAKTSSDSCGQQPKFVKRMARPCRKKIITTTTSIEDGVSAVASVADCNGLGGAAQACLHYSSVINAHAGYGLITCRYTEQPISYRPATLQYNNEHIGAWTDRIPYECQRDEYPPAIAIKTNDGYMQLEGHDPARSPADRQQYIRLIQVAANAAAGQIWDCPKFAEHHDVSGGTHEVVRGGLTTVYQSVRAIFTRKLIRINPIVAPGAVDAGLGVNPCQPRRPNIDDRGFALLSVDSWFNANPAGAALRPQYLVTPTGFAKRELSDRDILDLTIVDGNFSRRLTDEELRKDFGVIKCADDKCTKELEDLGIESALIDYNTPPSSPATAIVTSTTVSVALPSDFAQMQKSELKIRATLGSPRPTQGENSEIIREIYADLS